MTKIETNNNCFETNKYKQHTNRDAFQYNVYSFYLQLTLHWSVTTQIDSDHKTMLTEVQLFEDKEIDSLKSSSILFPSTESLKILVFF